MVIEPGTYFVLSVGDQYVRAFSFAPHVQRMYRVTEHLHQAHSFKNVAEMQQVAKKIRKLNRDAHYGVGKVREWMIQSMEFFVTRLPNQGEKKVRKK